MASQPTDGPGRDPGRQQPETDRNSPLRSAFGIRRLDA
jgi:hypothetical protein